MTAVEDQPPPVEGDGDMWMEVIEDMHERRATGIKRYGTPLQAYNGRDALVDLYQELLDAVVYTKQVLIEGAADVEPWREALRTALSTACRCMQPVGGPHRVGCPLNHYGFTAARELLGWRHD